MKILLKILRNTLLSIVGFILIFVIAVAIFVNTAPQFGASVSGEKLAYVKASPNYENGKFQNLESTIMNTMKAGDYAGLMYDFLLNGNIGTPKSQIPVAFNTGESAIVDSIAFVTWYGHSALLLEMEGKKILIDPMLGPASAPVSFTTKRFPYETPIDLDKIKNIDAVILSHDHYDHLDYPTILKIQNEVGHFYVPLGLGEHLIKWGVDTSKITQLDWGQSAMLAHIELTATPSRHFSGRGTMNQNTTLWASWVINGKFNNIYFSGDGGYGEHFKKIGDQYGPFDFAMMECGQYNTLWSQIHMTPEQTVQASIDVNTTLMMPIHWGAFKLAPHDWKDPVERVTKEAKIKNVTITTPTIGTRFSIYKPVLENTWWKMVD